MAVSAFPLVVDALVALSPDYVPAGVTVADAMPSSDDGSDFLAVGMPSIDEQGSMFAGNSRQSFAEVGNGARNEGGVVNCIAAARSTDETVKDARDRAFAIAEGVASLCRANPSLGVPQLLWASYGTETNPGVLYETGKPVSFFVEFQIEYRARI